MTPVSAVRSSAFDSDRYKWREVTAPAEIGYQVHHDYTILGYDLEGGTMDIVVRWGTDGGHCMIHRHTAPTSVFVLEGEQHLWDLQPDGTREAHRVRRAGEYGLTRADSLPHLERGGEKGGVVLFSSHSRDGLLYDIMDDHHNLIARVTMESLLADFEGNT